MSSDLGATSKDIWLLEEGGSDFLTLSSRDRQRRGVFWKIKHLTLTSILHTPLGEKNKQIQVFGLPQNSFFVFFFGCSHLWYQPGLCVLWNQPSWRSSCMGILTLETRKKLPGWPSLATIFGVALGAIFWRRNSVITIIFLGDLSDTYVYVLCIYMYMCVLHFFCCGEVSVFVLRGR